MYVTNGNRGDSAQNALRMKLVPILSHIYRMMVFKTATPYVQSHHPLLNVNKIPHVKIKNFAIIDSMTERVDSVRSVLRITISVPTTWIYPSPLL